RLFPAIEEACVYNKQGQVFAVYRRLSEEAGSWPPAVFETTQTLEGNQVYSFQPIQYKGETCGAIFLKVSVTGFAEGIRRELATLVPAAVLLLVLAFPIGVRFQRLVSDRLDKLAQATQRVAGGRDYSVRLETSGSDEIARVYGAFNDMCEQLDANERARDENRIKSEFLANMSHEIRTPLNTLIGLTNLALESPLTANLESYLQKMQVAGRSLLALINDILDFSRIEAGKITLEAVEFELEDVLDRLSFHADLRAAGKGLDVYFVRSPQVPSRLVGDPLRLEQVLVNLVDNAIKFTEQGSVRVVAELLERAPEKARLEFSVTDTGLGIEQEKLSVIFDAFRQADASTTRKFGGTGLGLSIAKQLVALMDGGVTVSSKPGEGSCFRFTALFGLPPAAEALAESQTVCISTVRALVVNVNEPERVRLAATLRGFSVETAEAANAQAGLERYEADEATRPFRFIVLSQESVDEADVLELTRRLLDRTATGNRPRIVLLTDRSRAAVGEAAASAGVSAILWKHPSASTLLDTMLSLFGGDPTRAPAHTFDARLAPQRLQGCRVLLVEDNEVNRLVATELLTRSGLVVSSANDGLEALKALEVGRFDVVLMDMQMPTMDGYEATRRIRSAEETRHLPIVALTAHAMAGDRQRCLEAGANDYVTKPINPRKLFSALRKLVQLDARSAALGIAASVPLPPRSGSDLLAALEPFVDWRNGLDRAVGNSELYIRLLRRFRDDYRDFTADLRRSIFAGDLEQAAWRLHTLKGAAGSLGAVAVSRSASQLDHGLRDKDAAVREERFGALQSAMGDLLGALATLPEPKEEPPIQLAPSERPPDFAPLLSELAAHLSASDTRARRVLEQLLPILPGAVSELAGPLRDDIERYRFGEALRRVEEMAQRLNVAVPLPASQKGT
ncbi:MAG: response regulator, partial [Candidatus Wallbacteria bacterium]|nr:response regulator [Candidatus Wallbacteria bacterium]